MKRRVRVLVAELAQDLRYGFRQWRLSPIFTATALIILAAGTGANLTLFGVFDALVLRPLPVHAPDQLVAFSAVDPKHPDWMNLAPLEAIEPFRAAQTVFTAPRRNHCSCWSCGAPGRLPSQVSPPACPWPESLIDGLVAS